MKHTKINCVLTFYFLTDSFKQDNFDMKAYKGMV